MPYPSYINYIAANEKVVPAVTNRPTLSLDLRTDNLKERLDTAELGQAVVLHDVPLSSSTVVGSPVYWNDTEKQFDLAYAKAEISSKYNEYIKSECANCIGLVYKKESSISGSIVVSGVVNLPDISGLFDEPGSGRFYLGATAGKLTHNILGVCVPVGTIIGKFGDCDCVYRVNVNPTLNDLWSHLHYAIDLKPLFTDDITKEGWRRPLSTDTNIPADTEYIYNMIPGTLLYSVFPPFPLEACSLYIDWNDLDETVGSKEIPLNCDKCLARVTNNGLYWVNKETQPFAPNTNVFIKCKDKKSGAVTWATGDKIHINNYTYTVPTFMADSDVIYAIYKDVSINHDGKIDNWKVMYTAVRDALVLRQDCYTEDEVVVSVTSTEKDMYVLPVTRLMREKLVLGKTQFSIGLSCVTSLQPYTGHPFQFVDCSDNPATHGELYAKFTLCEDPVHISTYDGYAMRRFNNQYKQEIVPEVNGIAVTGRTLSVSSNAGYTEVDGDKYYRGLAKIKIDPLDGSELAPQIMKLGDALEREFNGIMYVGFPRDRESSILAKFEVPAIFEGSMKLDVEFFSSIKGSFPSISCDYKTIRQPQSGEFVPLGSLEYTAIDWDTDDLTTIVDSAASSAFKLSTKYITVNPGDTIVVKLTRSSEGIAYSGDAGIIRINGVLRV